MGVYELKSTEMMSNESVTVANESTAGKGRNWGKMLLWAAIAIVIAGALV